MWSAHLVLVFQDSINDRRDHSIPWGLSLRLQLAGLTCSLARVVPQKQPTGLYMCGGLSGYERQVGFDSGYLPHDCIDVYVSLVMRIFKPCQH